MSRSRRFRLEQRAATVVLTPALIGATLAIAVWPLAAYAQARSRSFTPAPEELVRTPTAPTAPRGVVPPGVDPNDADQRGIIRKSPMTTPAPAVPGAPPAPRDETRPAAPVQSLPGARSAPPPPLPGPATSGGPGGAEPVPRYSVPAPVAPGRGAQTPSPAATAPREIIVAEPPSPADETELRPKQIIARAIVMRDAGGQSLDSRAAVDVADLGGIPFSAIGQIIVRFPSGDAQIGTGFLIEPWLVLTAAHVLLSPHAGRAQTAEFTPGCRAPGLPGKPGRPRSLMVGTDRTRVSETWLRGNFELAGDYGVLLLPDAAAFSDCGVLAVAPVAVSFIERHALQGSADFLIAGFPAEKTQGSQWLGFGALLRSPPAALFHVIDTTPGQSGAPLFGLMTDKTSGRKIPTAFGIHSRPADFALNYNRARRIDATVLADLRRWAEEAAPAPEGRP